jgi:anti-anti-sigma factor
MIRTEALPISLTRRAEAGHGDSHCSVVWLEGEHDVSSKLAVVSVIERVAELDQGDVQVDLSGVTFMDASIIGALVCARKHLRGLGLSLEVRAPSSAARSVLDLCGVSNLIAAPEAMTA